MRTSSFDSHPLAALVVGALASAYVMVSCVVTDEEHIVEPTIGGAGGTLSGGAGGSGGDGNPEGGGGSGGGSGGAGGTPPPSGGEIACGDQTCLAPGEVCCAAGASFCATYAECEEIVADQTGESLVSIMACDDASDCGAGRCCVADSGNAVVYACSSSACEAHESCSATGSCRDGDDLCVSAPATASGHKCVEGDSDVECNGVVCSGAAAVCCAGNTCEDFGACAAGWECDGPSDCGGATCCLVGGGSQCRGTCPDASVMCGSTSDCPGQPTACDATGLTGAPPELKLCQY